MTRRQLYRILVLGSALGISAALGCSDSERSVTGPGPASASTAGLVVSEPVRLGGVPGVAGNAVAFSGATDSVVYVSLLPGTVPGGTEGSVRNLASGTTLTTPMQNGGFDPVAIPALTGDTVEIEVATIGGGPVLMKARVESRSPPVVVRTDPPEGQVDVPLNAFIAVIFSEPMDPATIRPGVIQVLRNGQPVSATVSLAANGWEATVKPDSLLAPNANHRIRISTVAQDVAGDTLENEVNADFVTTLVVPVASVVLSPDSATMDIGGQLQVAASALDSAGQPVTGRAVSFSSSDSTVARIDSAGRVSGIATGVTSVTATIDGVTGSATIAVVPLSFATISAGGAHTCGLTTRATVSCWGDNSLGQLGAGDTVDSSVPRGGIGVPSFLSVVSGDVHTVGLTPSVYEWGQRFGGGQSLDRPTAVAPGEVFDSASAGGDQTCFLRSGEPFCWGLYENLRCCTIVFSGLPWPLHPVPPMVSITSGLDQDCGLTAAGAAYCWGRNNWGQLGDGTTKSTEDTTGPFAFRAALVGGGLSYVSLSAGEFHTCGITSSGEAYCWGVEEYSNGPAWPWNASPQVVLGGPSFISVEAGDRHTCALTPAGDAYCWGRNDRGQLGNGTLTSSTSPVPVANGPQFLSISAGGRHTCGLAANGRAYCWGDNSQGQLGDGTALNRSVPVAVVGQR